MAVNTPALFYRGFPAYGASSVTRVITTAALTGNLVTITLSANHGYTQVGQLVSVQGAGTVYDGVYPIHSYPALNTFTYVKTNANISSAAVSPNASATFNVGTTGGAISNQGIQGYTAIITTSAAHGLAIGDIVAVNTGTSGTDVAAVAVTSVPTTTTFTFASNTGTLASTAVTQGAWGKFPTFYTLPSLTTAVITNLVLTNLSQYNAAQFYVTVAGTPVIGNLSVPVNSSTVIDMKNYLATTGDKIIVGTTIPQATATISGMTIV